MIRIEHLSKSFRGRRAVHDVSLDIAAGTITGLLGPNGAGKSTLIGMMLGQVRPDAGEVFIDGVSVQRDRRRALRRVGATFEAPGFYAEFTGAENLEYLASLSGGVAEDEIAEAVEFVGLRDTIGRRVGEYSRGMRLRLALAQTLVPRPAVVVLDEPMEGLDPAGIRDARALIRRLRDERGVTVLLSSHLLAEVERLCDRVVIVCRGGVLFSGEAAGDSGELEKRYLEVVERE